MGEEKVGELAANAECKGEEQETDPGSTTQERRKRNWGRCSRDEMHHLMRERHGAFNPCSSPRVCGTARSKLMPTHWCIVHACTSVVMALKGSSRA